MDVQSTARYLPISPVKIRLVCDQVRGLDPKRALEILKFMPQKGAPLVGKVIKSAMANAENNFNMDPDDLVITSCQADEGRTLKRWRPRARGRVNQILKRSSHITVVVAEKGS